MKNYLEQKTVVEFIQNNWQQDIITTAFQLSKSDLPKEFILNQINGKQKAKQKLPIWFENECVLYSSKLSMEQASSELTASFKASLIEGNVLVDLTGGFGVDDFFFSNHFKQVYHCELNKELSDIVAHNVNVLKKNNNNIQCINDDSLNFLKNIDNVDVIYIDPARRNNCHQKVFRFEDCLPNIVNHFDYLISKTSQILVKASPMIDIIQGLRELKFVKKVFVISVKNECKEVLFLIEKGCVSDVEIECVELYKLPQKFVFKLQDEQKKMIGYTDPQKYLYEPNTSILKAGSYKMITIQGVNKIAQHSHLYTSNELVEDFMGRIFEIKDVCAFSKKELIRKVGKKANITIRNFPYSVQEIRKKTGIKDGGEYYLFCTTNSIGKPIIIITKKVRT